MKRAVSHPKSSEPLHIARLIGRVATIQRTCLKFALKESPDIEPEWYYFLHSIHERTEIRKTDVISINLLAEPTTGIDILNRMINAGLLTETVDPKDKRARLLKLTPSGQKKLAQAEKTATAITTLLYAKATLTDLPTHLAIIEKVFSKVLIEAKPTTLAQLHAAIAAEITA